MKRNLTFLAAALAAGLLAPAAQAQGVLGGAQDGIEQGNEKGGPVGAVVGGAVGAVTGGVNGLLGIEQRPKFRKYVIDQHRTSYRIEDELAVGTVLPAEGVVFYEVPADYGLAGYNYTVVNDRVVLVEPGSRRVVQIIN